MSDVMLLGVLRMPMTENPDPLTLRQFVSRARQAADRIEADAAELESLRRDAERYRFLRAVDHIPISPQAARDPVAYDAAIDAAMTGETR